MISAAMKGMVCLISAKFTILKGYDSMKKITALLLALLLLCTMLLSCEEGDALDGKSFSFSKIEVSFESPEMRTAVEGSLEDGQTVEDYFLDAIGLYIKNYAFMNGEAVFTNPDLELATDSIGDAYGEVPSDEAEEFNTTETLDAEVDSKFDAEAEKKTDTAPNHQPDIEYDVKGDISYVSPNGDGNFEIVYEASTDENGNVIFQQSGSGGVKIEFSTMEGGKLESSTSVQFGSNADGKLPQFQISTGNGNQDVTIDNVTGNTVIIGGASGGTSGGTSGSSGNAGALKDESANGGASSDPLLEKFTYTMEGNEITTVEGEPLPEGIRMYYEDGKLIHEVIWEDTVSGTPIKATIRLIYEQ